MTHDCAAYDSELASERGARFGTSFLAGLVAAISRRVAERRAAQTLSDMDDHLLQDIGVSRDEIQRLVHTGKVETAPLEPGRPRTGAL